MSDYIDEYLVKLGFTRDLVSEAEVQKSLDTVKKLVEDHVGSIGKSMLEWQGAITAGFLSVGAAAVGLLDKLANADLATKSLAARMMLSVSDTRAFAESLKLLNATPEDLMANPQLARYAGQLFADNQRMQQEVGTANIESTFTKIEDLQQEFTRLHSIIDFLTMEVPLKLWDKLMPGNDLLASLQSLNEKLIQGIDKYSDRLANFFVPIMKDVKFVFDETVDAAKDFALLFTNVVGLLSGDSSIEGSTFNWEKFGRAIQDVVHGLREFVDLMVQAEKLASHTANALILAVTGHSKDAADQSGQAAAAATPGAILVDLVLGLSAAAAAVKTFGVAAKIATWPLKTLGIMGRGGAQAGEAAEAVGAGEILEGGMGLAAIGPIVAVALPIIITALAAYGLYKNKDAVEAGNQGFLDMLGVPKHGLLGEHLDAWKNYSDQHPGLIAPSSQVDHLKSLAQQVADRTGADPQFIFGDLMHESDRGTNRGARDLHNYSGIKNPGGKGYRNFDSDAAYVDFYSALLQRDYPGAIAARNAHDFAEGLKHGRGGRSYYQDSEQIYEGGVGHFASYYGRDQRSGAGGSGDVSQTIGSINVKIDGTNMTQEQVAAAVATGVKTSLRDHARSGTGQLVMQSQGVYS